MKRYLLVMGGSERGWSRHNEENVFRDYDAEADRLIESAKPWGLECIKFNNDSIIKSEFYDNHKDVLDRISFGFTFKAICFWKTLQQVDNDDLLLFVDSNHVIQKDPSIFYNITDVYGMFVHDHIWTQYPNYQWTRKDTFVNMDLDEEKYWNSLQMQCNIIGIKKNEFSMKFVKEWLDFSLDSKVMFGENKYLNMNGFKEHRHDQSLFSLLVAKYEIPYLNRTNNVELEFIIPELDGITPVNPIDNSYRKDQDRLDNK